VDLYLTPSDFARRKLIEGGAVPEKKIVTKPNFLPADPGMGEHQGGFALFVGRLAEEKGIRRLLEVWGEPGRRIPLKVVGDGPLAPLLRGSNSQVEWLGQRSRDEVLALLKDAAFLIFPSECYETFGLTIIEAFATGLPVIASKLGSADELVSHGDTGVHFRAGDTAGLAAAVDWATDHPREMAAMGTRARAEYLERFTAARNYQALMESYFHAMQLRGHVPEPASDRSPAVPATLTL
jgi:glycosyltransferase involved in cell wall biosynthesis